MKTFLEQKCDEFFKELDTLSDEEVVEKFSVQTGAKGWASTKSAYLKALTRQFDKREIDYSAIKTDNGISLRDKVRLEGKKMILVMKES